jgi:hypothetical protein
MSSDLLEAFGLEDADSSGKKDQKSSSNQVQSGFFTDIGNLSTSGQTSASKPAPQQAAAEEDDWGDFEDAPQTGRDPLGFGHTKNAPSTSNRYKYGLDELGPAAASNPQPNRDEIDLLSQEFSSATIAAGAARHVAAVNATNANRDSDVLFDASDDGEGDEEDDFGDFEDYVPEIEPQQQPVEIDLLGLDEPPATMPVQTTVKTDPPKSTEHDTFGESWDDFTPPLHDTKAVKTTVKTDPRKPMEHDTFGESWDDFTPTNHDVDGVESAKPMIDFATIKGSVDPVELNPAMSSISIPPPSVLLSTFVPIVEAVEKELVQPLASHEAAIRQEILSDPKTAEYVRGYLLVMTVCGHIMGGRKLRWKRDSVLGQSMRIGHAGTRSSGLKLTTVDKTEVTKEDGEVAEVLRVWNRQAGRIKSIAVEAKKASNTDVGLVPELRETMTVKTMKQSEGGIPSRKPCLLCGLKREERVGKVSFDIEDNFGEWWVEGANMHRCITSQLVILANIGSLPELLGRTRTRNEAEVDYSAGVSLPSSTISR